MLLYQGDASTLRQRAGTNHFKELLLKNQHRPGEPQVQLVMDSIAQLVDSSTLDPRTWRNWFGRSPARARVDAVLCLDQCAAQIPGLRKQPPNFYQELICGGLMRRLSTPTKSKSPKAVLEQRACDYTPISALHLHFDAIDVATFSSSNGAADMETVKVVATERLMEILHHRWHPRFGHVYPSLTSDLALEWAASTEAERTVIRRTLDRFTPPMFDHWLSLPPRPKVDSFADSRDLAPTQVHRLLLALAADAEFLRADRADAWSLDLATSALTLHSHVWAKGYMIAACGVEPEVIYLAALDSLLYGEDKDDELELLLSRALALGEFDWMPDSYETLISARQRYHVLLDSLGLAPSMVAVAVESCESAHPIRVAG